MPQPLWVISGGELGKMKLNVRGRRKSGFPAVGESRGHNYPELILADKRKRGTLISASGVPNCRHMFVTALNKKPPSPITTSPLQKKQQQQQQKRL